MDMDERKYRPCEVPLVRCADCVHGWRLGELCMAEWPVPLHWMGRGRCPSFERRAERPGRPRAGDAGKH